MYTNRNGALVLVLALAPRREAFSHNPRARRLSRYGHDLAEQRIEMEYVCARRALYRVRNELGRGEGCVDRYEDNVSPEKNRKGEDPHEVVPSRISTGLWRVQPRATLATVGAPVTCAARTAVLPLALYTKYIKSLPRTHPE
jgi:hypothetical protein